MRAVLVAAIIQRSLRGPAARWRQQAEHPRGDGAGIACAKASAEISHHSHPRRGSSRAQMATYTISAASDPTTGFEVEVVDDSCDRQAIIGFKTLADAR